MEQNLEVGQVVEVVDRRNWEVVQDTTGFLEFPTYEVWNRDTSRFKAVSFNSETGHWEILSKPEAIRYYAKKSLIRKELKNREKKVVVKSNMPRKFGVTSYARSGKYDIDKILPLLKGNHGKDGKREYIELDGIKIKTTSQRYLVFRNSLQCASCGLKATHFAAERCLYQEAEHYHFNLYGLKDDGSEVMFTKDHIVPKAAGGKNKLQNLQTMCVECNQKKDCKMELI